jgi:hypothetical protein
VNTPNCEIIRGEVSIFLGGAGGLSYFSSGSFRGAAYVGASCPEAVASEARKARQIKRLVAEAVDDLIRWSVVEALPPSPSLRQAKEALNR